MTDGAVTETTRPTRWAWWAVAAGAALLFGSQWLHAPNVDRSVDYLVLWLIATAASLALAIGAEGAQRRWIVAGSLLLAISGLAAIPTQRDLARLHRDADGWRRDAAVRGLALFKRELDSTAAAGVAAVRFALGAPRDRTRAFESLAALSDSPTERGVVLFRGDSAFAWSGTIRAGVDRAHDGIVVVGTPFYLALQFAQRGPDRSRAVASALLGALPPADRLSSPLAKRVADEAGLRGFFFDAPSDTSSSPDVLRYAINGQRLFDVRASSLSTGQIVARVTERGLARAGTAFALALALFIIGVWRGSRSLTPRIAALAVAITCTALVPLNQYSNITRAFDPSVYYTPEGGPLTASAGALFITASLAVLSVLAVFRRSSRRVSRPTAIATVLLVAGLGPFLLRDLARGISVPSNGVDSHLWLIWEVPLFLAAVSVLLTGASAGAAVLGANRGLAPWVAPAAAAVAAVFAPLVWQAPGSWPWWYTLLWVAAIGMLALSRRTRFVIASAAAVAALGATTLVWARTARGRVDAAERDLAGLEQADSVNVSLLRRLAETLAADVAPTTRRELLQHYVMSDIASSGNPIALSAWPTDSGPSAVFETAHIPLAMEDEALFVRAARESGRIILEAVPTDTALEIVMAVPSASGGVTAAVLAPRTRLFDPDPFARLLGLDVDTETEPPYTLQLRERIPGDTTHGRVVWRRDGSQLHGDWNAPPGAGSAAHVEVELTPPAALFERGVLIVGLDFVVVAVLWLASVVADGGGGRWIRARRRTWGRSYRLKLSLALFAFFVIPATAFVVWSYGELATDANQSRALLVTETLRALAAPVPGRIWLPAESERLDAPLFMYRSGELTETSDQLYTDLAPIGRFLDPGVELNLAVRGEETTTEVDRINGGSSLFGFRAFDMPDSASTVVASPARANELALGRRRRALGIHVLFATAIGALAALWLSGVAARSLARPIGSLRAAALSIAAGEREPPLESEPTAEFNPVFTAFRRMASDLNASRTALEEAQRRTAAVLRNVASGVAAVDANARVTLANPRAEALLDTTLEPGASFLERAPAPIAHAVERFLKSGQDEETFELSVDQQQIRGTLTRLGRGRGGTIAVVTLDDVTELARAQRVLAWGEMARQVAHEIKNPLTPIRLGVQHLRRARHDSRVDFDQVLDKNVNLILAEIDRLDEIARSFSRYGAVPDEVPSAIPVDVAAVVREVVSLERMGEESALSWQEEGVDSPVTAFARGDELKEVLLNVLENARLAEARSVRVAVAETNGVGPSRVVITVRDDGHGIPADVLPRIFEPHFSTRTSGSGLGLAISRRLVDGWGGELAVESTEGVGTTVRIALRPAGDA